MIEALSLLLMVASVAEVRPAPTASDAAFARLSALMGVWRRADRPESPLRVRFYLTAGGTVLVEEWTANGAPHSLTLYHRDGANLLATHYCPQGNQPRLALISQSTGPTLAFTFRDATDLESGESVQHSLAFDLSDPARLVRSETYRRGEGEEADRMVLVRESDSAGIKPQADQRKANGQH